MAGLEPARHFFDLKLPLGGLLTAYGVILTVYGYVSSPLLYEKSLGINVNFIWGIVMLAVGGLFLLATFLKRKS